WLQWVSGADIVQMNEHEASSLLECDCPVPQERLAGLAQEALQGRAKVLLVTLAERGAFVAEKTATGVRSQLVPACHVERVVDPTGCGDAFAAGFLHHYLEKGDAQAAAVFANKVAAINCSLLGAENVEAIAEGLHRLHGESQSRMNHRERSAAT
ncbi:MAG: hypothetical protein H5U38_09030, partial [Calditrichaeota bacterium]|nr:hypothetical protein [Calditrichota bacterium]